MKKVAFVTIVWVAVAIVIGSILLFNDLLSKEQKSGTVPESNTTTDQNQNNEPAPGSDLLPTQQELDSFNDLMPRQKSMLMDNIIKYLEISKSSVLMLPLSNKKTFKVRVPGDNGQKYTIEIL